MHDKVCMLLFALSNPVRLRIVEILMKTEKPLHIEGIARQLKMDYGAVYRHIDLLKKVGIIDIYEVGRSRVPYLVKKKEMENFLMALEKLL